ncbi:PHD finger protein ALFIN-LIKE 4 [Glycine soja]|nr:PHD finger protein ALFIN-LIKE 4 [Glycine soja]
MDYGRRSGTESWSTQAWEIHNSSHNGINVPDANLVPISCTSDVINLMNLGYKNRVVGSTAMNDRYSLFSAVIVAMPCPSTMPRAWTFFLLDQEVNLPVEELPSELPEPVLGINFARDGMQEKDWLSLVVVHSDTWLLALAFYFGARFGFDKTHRNRLFSMINELPTIFEVVTSAAKKQVKEKSSVSNNSGSKSKSRSNLYDFISCI